MGQAKEGKGRGREKKKESEKERENEKKREIEDVCVGVMLYIPLCGKQLYKGPLFKRPGKFYPLAHPVNKA